MSAFVYAGVKLPPGTCGKKIKYDGERVGS